MREITATEMTLVSGGTNATFAAGAIGLMVSIPVIVGGAILGVPTLGLGFVAMALGIVGTALSGALVLKGIVSPGTTPTPTPAS